jgi:hypothetical protein
MAFRACCVFRRSGKAVTALLLAVLAAPAGVLAEPLAKEACDKLVAEKQSLTMLGVDKEYAKGADWAKANLAQGELNNLKRFLTIDEQLKFRCGMAVVTLQVTDEPEDGDDDEGGAAGAGVPLPERRDESAAAVKPGAKPAVAPAKTEPAAVKPATPATTAPKPAPPKAQSSWNPETMPTQQIAPAGMMPLETVIPKSPKTAPRSGEQG